MSKKRVFRLSDNEHKTSVLRLLSERVDEISLSEDRKVIDITVTRIGNFYNRRYGNFKITKAMLLSMVRNFDTGIYGQDIVLDVAHKFSDGAAGFFKRLYIEGNKLRATVELTEFGIKAIKEKGFVYVSAEFDEDFEDNEERKKHGATLIGAGLTVRPVIKHLDRVQLSEAELSGAPMTLISDHIIKTLSEDIFMDKFLKQLQTALTAITLSEEVKKSLVDSFKLAAEPLADDAGKLKILTENFEQQAKLLSDAIGDKNVTLNFDVPKADTGLSADEVKKMLSEHTDRINQQAADHAKKLSDNQATFTKLLDEADGLANLPDSQRKILSESVNLITADTSEAQIKALAEQQIKLGEELAISSQLSGMGYQVKGNAHITVDDSNNVKSLQETVDRRLGYISLSESERFANTDGKLQDKNKALAEEVLAQFDLDNAVQLRHEHKMLSGGDGSVSDTAFPVIAERTVIRESLYRLTGLQFVNSGVMPFGESATLPYSYRDRSAAGRNDTRRYEGQEIARAGVIQTTDTVEPIPQKLSFSISDELGYLTRNGMIDFNAAIENVSNAARIIGEDTDTLLFDEIIHSNDEFGAVAVTDEDIPDADIDGTNNLFPLAYFPVVHPRKRFTLKGVQIGNTLNPITVLYDSGSGFTEIAEYDGTNEQLAGNYYSLDYNQGEIAIVDEKGLVKTPAAAHAIRVSYSRVTNNFNFDINIGSLDLDVHWNSYLHRLGLQKTEIQKGRQYMANFGLMSETFMNQVEQAKQFIANFSKPGTSLNSDGTLGRIKSVPMFDTAAPGLSMADDRMVLGERSQTRFRMMKPWQMGELENQRGPNGRFTGQKEAYGDQFIVVHTPAPLKNATTAITLFDSTVRAARAE